jgi:hypothetical protein
MVSGVRFPGEPPKRHSEFSECLFALKKYL